MTVIAIGHRPETFFAPDGGIVFVCPNCSHCLPSQPRPKLDTAQGDTSVIQCRCAEGLGTHRHSQLALSGCQCACQFTVVQDSAGYRITDITV